MNPKTPSKTEIERKAYELWEAEGRPEGRDIAHWHQAERDISEPVIRPIPEASPLAATASPAKPEVTRPRKPGAGEDAAAAAKAAPSRKAPPRDA